MSRWNSKADAIRTYLISLPCTGGMEVIVHRADNFLSQVTMAFEKSAGNGCLVIKWLGGKNPDTKLATLRMGGRYSISLWTKLITANEETPADDLIEEIATGLHGWVDSRPGALNHRLEVEEVNLVPDVPGMLVHEIIASFYRV